MTLQEAYRKAKGAAEMEGHPLFVNGRDYGDFWGFYFVRENFRFDEPSGGGGDITVNKKTGAIGFFFPPMDFDLAKKAIPIHIEQFAEYNVAI
jgi:hypothetical protein